VKPDARWRSGQAIRRKFLPNAEVRHEASSFAVTASLGPAIRAVCVFGLGKPQFFRSGFDAGLRTVLSTRYHRPNR
jgi:hypothetical protein